MKAYRWFLLVLATAFGLAVLGTTPPGRWSVSGQFDRAAAMGQVRAIARAPHPTGSAENERVRAHIAAQMRAIGMDVAVREGLLDARGTERRNFWSGRSDPPQRLFNIVGTLPGRDRSAPAVLLMAHHDTVWGSPGAADDTAGVASALTVARQVAGAGQPGRDLIVLITDGEELGLQGAARFFAGDPLLGHIGAVINMEARGGGGRTSLFQTSAGNGEVVAAYARAVGRPAASSLGAYVYSVLPNDTDLTEALPGKWPAWNFAFIGRPGLYHSPLATPDNLDPGALDDMGEQVLALTRHLLAAPDLPKAAPDVVFFDLFGLGLVTYPAAWGWAMIALSAALLGLAARREPDLRALGRGAGRMGALLLVAGFALFLLNIASGAGHHANYYDRLAAIPLLEGMGLLACAASFLLVLGKGLQGPARQAGAALLPGLIGLAVQAIAPTAAYIVVLPVLLGTLTIALGAMAPQRLATPLCGLIGAVTAGYMLVLGHQLMQGVGPTMPFAASLPLGLAALALLPLWPGLSHRHARQGGLVLLALALAVALWVRLDPIADTVAVYSLKPR